MFRPILAWTVLVASASCQLYLVDSDLDRLYTVDPMTGAATLIGSTLPMNTPCGLAHDGTNLYALDLGSTTTSTGTSVGALCTLNISTGAPTVLGPTGLNGWQDITFDPTTNTFFGVNQNGSFYSIAPNGTTTLITSALSAYLLTALAVDANGTLWAIDFFGGSLGTLNKTTGVFTIVGVPSPANFQGMSFDPVSGVLYATNTTTDSLYTINTTTAAATLVGPHGNSVQFAKGMTFAGSCPQLRWQVNAPESSLSLDGLTGTSCFAAISTKAANAPSSVVLATALATASFEVVLAPAALIPLGSGAITTPSGQILNVPLTATPLVFLNGGLAPAFAPLPVPITLNFNAPQGPVTFSVQMAVLNPAAPDGFNLSAPAQLNVP